MELATVKFNMEFVMWTLVQQMLLWSFLSLAELTGRPCSFLGFFYVEYVHMVDTKLWDIKS